MMFTLIVQIVLTGLISYVVSRSHFPAAQSDLCTYPDILGLNCPTMRDPEPVRGPPACKLAELVCLCVPVVPSSPTMAVSNCNSSHGVFSFSTAVKQKSAFAPVVRPPTSPPPPPNCSANGANGLQGKPTANHLTTSKSFQRFYFYLSENNESGTNIL